MIAGGQRGSSLSIASRPAPTAAGPAAQQCRRRVARCLASREHFRAPGDGYDVILSSGFLAFASHSGFLQAIEDAGLPVAGVMGTSAGALTGSLYAAGYSPRQAAAELSRSAPIDLLRPCLEPWRGGLLSLDDVVSRLRQLLPPTFEDLQRDFAVGVVTAEGEHILIDSGPLPEAVAASAAIPFIFASVDVPGVAASLKDGGVVDRIGLKAWRERRRRQLHRQHQLMASSFGSSSSSSSSSVPTPPCLIHVIERSSPFSGCDDAMSAGEHSIHVVRSPKSGVNFFDLGNFSQQFDTARNRARSSLETYALARTAAAPASSQASSSNDGSGSDVGGGSLSSVLSAAALAAPPAASGAGGKGATLVTAAVRRKPPPAVVAGSSGAPGPSSPGNSSGRPPIARAVKEE